MKYRQFSLMTAVTIFMLKAAEGESTADKREGKYLGFEGYHHMGKLRFERILENWNSSYENDPAQVSSEKISGTATSESPAMVREEIPQIRNFNAFADRFSTGFKGCILAKKKDILRSVPQGKQIIYKCFRVELVRALHDVIGESGSMALLKGYVLLESAGKSGNAQAQFGGNDEENEIRDTSRSLDDDSESFYSKIRYFPRNDTATERRLISRFQEELVREVAHDLSGEGRRGRSLEESVIEKDFASILTELSKKYALRFKIWPGISARMKRSKSSSGFTFDLELDDLGFGGDEDDDKESDIYKGTKIKGNSEEDEDEEDEEEDEEDEDEDDDGEEEEDGENKSKDKKKFKNKLGKGDQKKKKFKMIKKVAPFLIIPMMIQALMLPIAFKFLLFFAIKALLAGKVALMLVGINLIKNAKYKSQEDEYIERVGQEHYGYGQGEEYGAWINGRSLKGHDDPGLGVHPYREYAVLSTGK